MTSRARSVTAKEPCPICGAVKRCLLGSKGPLCYRQGGPGAVELTDRQGETYWLHPAEGSNPAPMPTPTDQPPECGPPEQRDAVYRWLQGELELQFRHHQNLVGRGLTKEAIKAHGFRTLPQEWSLKSNVAKLAAERWPDRWQNIPGFALKKGQPALVGAPGLALFGRDLDGKIVAVKIRLDEPADGCRYRWLSGAGGPGVGSPATWWAPLTRSAVAGEARVVEGMLKAVVSAELTGVPAIAAGAGVSSLAGPEVVAMLRRLKPTLIRLAPDADALDPSKEVGRLTRTALGTLEHLAADLGARLVVDTWPTDETNPKGIDDALAAGLTLAELSPTAYRQRLESVMPKPEVNEAERGLPLLERAVLALGTLCDGAAEQDGIGFNAKDAGWFSPHVESVRAGVGFAGPLRKRIFERIAKYSGQLHRLKFNIHQISEEETERKRDSKGEEPTQVEKLLDLSADWKFIKHDGKLYASMLTQLDDGTFRRDTLRFSRGGVRKKLQHLYFLEHGGAPSSEALNGAMGTMEARAEFEGADESVFLRTGLKNGRVYLDLADDQGRVVAVSPSGWEITQDPPVYFERTQGMLPIPVPVRGGSLEELRPFVNLCDQGFILSIAWLLFAIYPAYPHPILLLEGPQGSCKSWLAKMLRSIIDPHSVAFRKAPRDSEDIAICAANNWVCSYDNLSWSQGIPGELADTFSGLATGSGHARRAHYSNDEEAAFSYLRPVLWTAIPGLRGKTDLAERILKVETPMMSESDRKLESELVGDDRFEMLRPRILGCLLDAVACALRNAGKKRLPKLPRLADFVQFAIDAGDALPWSDEEFLTAFNDSRSEQVESMIDADPVASSVRVLAGFGRWEGTVSDLAERLSKLTTNPRDIPPPRHLGIRLRLAEANLRASGVEACFSRSKTTRHVVIDRTQREHANLLSPTSPRKDEPSKPVTMGFFRETSSVTTEKNDCHPMSPGSSWVASDDGLLFDQDPLGGAL